METTTLELGREKAIAAAHKKFWNPEDKEFLDYALKGIEKTYGIWIHAVNDVQKIFDSTAIELSGTVR